MRAVERVKLKIEKHGRKLSTLHFQFSIQNIAEYIEFWGKAHLFMVWSYRDNSSSFRYIRRKGTSKNCFAFMKSRKVEQKQE